MKRDKIKLLLAFLAGVIIPACSSSSGPKEIMYGHYCGMCMGHCVSMVKIVGDEVFIDTTNNFFFKEHGGYDFKGIKLNDEVAAQVKKAVSIPSELQSEKERIGEPDARDQCGYYIQIRKGENVREWYIDPGMHPGYLDAILLDIKKALKLAYGK